MSLSVFKKFALLALLMVSFSFFTSCSNDEAKVKSTAKKVVKAMKDGDIETMIKYMPKKEAADMKKQLKDMKKEDKEFMVAMMQMMGEEVVKYGKVTIDGETAKIELIVKNEDGKEEEDDADFVKEDGKWKMKLEG